MVKDKVGRPSGELGVSKSMECDIIITCNNGTINRSLAFVSHKFLSGAEGVVDCVKCSSRLADHRAKFGYCFSYLLCVRPPYVTLPNAVVMRQMVYAQVEGNPLPNCRTLGPRPLRV